MATFTALNIEPDDQSDDEVDNTKEIQFEEALKRYQVALKLHSQGPPAYEQAAEAYSHLFKSDIFKYPEAITEFTRLDEHPELEYSELFAPLDIDLAAAGTDMTPNSLPQILYLSYKNNAQFVLDCIKCRLRNPLMDADEGLQQGHLDIQAKFALEDFARAVSRDESDAELWRRAARIGAMLGSRRIARYCLEAAVEVDDDPTLAEIDPANLEEGFAGEQLKKQLQVLDDEVALSHPIMAPFMRKNIAPILTKYMDPYPFLPDHTKSLVPKVAIADGANAMQERPPLDVRESGWTALGEKLCEEYLTPRGLSAARIVIQLPPGALEDPKDIDAALQDQIMEDVATESPVVEGNGFIVPTPSTIKAEDEAVEIVTSTTPVPLQDDKVTETSIALPTRKRSHFESVNRDATEEDGSNQKRSKRIRNRDNTSDDTANQYAEQLNELHLVDVEVFNLVHNHLAKLGVHDLGTVEDLKKALLMTEPGDREEVLTNASVRDLRYILRTWDDGKAATFLNGNAADILGCSTGGANAGLAAFLEHSKSGPQKLSSKPLFAVFDGLSPFVNDVNDHWRPLQDVIFDWTCTILSTYRGTLWPDGLKVALVQVITYADADIFERLKFDMQRLRCVMLESADSAAGEDTSDHLSRLEDFAQTLYELHLDIYSRITNPNSIVPIATRVMTKERLDRWADYAAEIMTSRPRADNDELSLRYLWASVFYATMSEELSREHKVLCWTDLQNLLKENGDPTIELQNNAVMPEVSISAAEREASQLTTMEFFYNLFEAENPDPTVLIETLEPVLDPESACPPPVQQNGNAVADAESTAPAGLRDMWKFLQGGSTSLRLFLWQRLREAYSNISYNTKVFSCHLKCIEIIVEDLRTEDYADSGEEPRRHKLLLWLKALDDLLVKTLTIALNDSSACFEIIDDRHLKSTCAALARLNRILHAAALFEDEVSIGITQLPQTSAFAPQGSFTIFNNKLREMQVRTWSLQFTMLKEAMSQNRELLGDEHNDVANYLAVVHSMLGLRKFCKASNKIFLKMMKVEMMRLKDYSTWDDHLEQVVFDLYGTKFGVGRFALQDHGCPPESLDRRTVLNIAEYVIDIANRMPMKDLMKHELKGTIEKMQEAVGQAKPTPQMQHNLRNYTEYLKTSIRPLHLYQAFKGQIQVDSLPVITSDSALAEKGWYFLLGMIALTKFRSQKRLGPGGTDDLRVGATFMRLQLQYTADHWETWYRLAQCFDAELEEEVMWNADKMNGQRPELNGLQRSAIHCYIMALSAAIRTAEDSPETAKKLCDMFFDFGMRMYASSREPFTMEAFYVDDFEKHCSGVQGLYKKPLHDEMTPFKVWKYAAGLFRRALVYRPGRWMTHFMLGKAQWKMYRKADSGDDPWDRESKPDKFDMIDCFHKAVELCPRPRDSRTDPILEPHYKIISILHKMVVHSDVKPQPAADILQLQHYASQKGAEVRIETDEEWERFVLDSLRRLRNIDKQHWHHRMIAQVIGILYDDEKPDYVQAHAARQEFRESIFTKAMYIQVWKPELERAGRHFVYTERYVRLMIKLLWILNDKFNMDQLARRIRKKSSEFYRFDQVWQECCTTYLRMIRRAASIPPNMDEVFKTVTQEEHEYFSERVIGWLADPNTSHTALDALRDTIEFKKLNNNLMKVIPIDDLINDIWAYLYTQISKLLPTPDSSLPIAQVDGEMSARANGPMSLNTVMNTNGDNAPAPSTTAPAAPSASASGTAIEPPRPRKTGISRREVLKKAEIAIARFPDSSSNKPASATKTKAPEAPPRSASTPRVELPSSLQGHNGKEDNSSVPGSLHDSADDESDLSDAPDLDETETAVLFPNLVVKNENSAVTETNDGGRAGIEEERDGDETVSEGD